MTRAAPLPPADRRQAIMAVTERLIVEQGGEVSTRAIAKAAGIAEGTIFRVFPTKDAIIAAIFADAFDRETREREIAAVDMTADLHTRMVELVRILQRRIRRIMVLFGALGFPKPPTGKDGRTARQHEHGVAAIAAVLEPDRDRLRLPPPEAARMLHAMIMALTTPMLSDRPEADPADIVNLLLNGIALHPSQRDDQSC